MADLVGGALLGVFVALVLVVLGLRTVLALTALCFALWALWVLVGWAQRRGRRALWALAGTVWAAAATLWLVW